MSLFRSGGDTPISLGPEKSLKGFRREEARLFIERFVADASPALAEDFAETQCEQTNDAADRRATDEF